MTSQKPGRRGRNCEFVLKKKGDIVESFQTMGSVARFLKVCITTVLNTINKKKNLKGFTIECIHKKPDYIRMFTINGKLINKFETISDAAKKLNTIRKGNPDSLESGISFAIRTETLRFGYWWRKDGFKKPLVIVCHQPDKRKKICTYMRYYENSDIYKKCGKAFVSEGNHNHYCPSCREYINLSAISSYENKEVKISNFYNNEK